MGIPKTPGAIARAVLGDRAFRPIGRVYRRVFVDLDAVADAVGGIPPDAKVLDVGGGDGDLINRLLRRFADIHVTMIDVAATVGGWIAPDLEARTTKLPSTSIADFDRSRREVSFVLVSDVVHHVPPEAREAFADELCALVHRTRATLVIKDIEPGSPRAALSRFADRYITGDRHVELISARELDALLAPRLPEHAMTETDLVVHDAPNYLLRYAPRR